ncbi:Fructokinase [Halanaerobium saccharolyticum subsp. saccharolyticum DSM 6643]|uniref:Fructokinase n=1 Tax=Halanaerobium saccharolyticum subsp. saccharolyticum DSM 6643 TaxID=1293054 RepID=M5E354_9FIRM|nr:carbohydrate kinase [Halanaerobium saccharolyticum]CCU80685.1 Fructokinase [Halanaerobium saccharolyticum subsp. saccharolyticum DSM 6643]
MQGVITLGEALIDFTPLDDQNMDFRKNPGGAPANVAVALSRLGVDVSFVGKVGNDVLGNFLAKKLQSENVNIENLVLTDEAKTAITFVTLDEDGDRSFDFYIDPSADRFLREDEIDAKLFEQNKIYHFGSISLIDEPARSATKKGIELAHQNEMLISYDPNLREMLWDSLDEAKEIILSVMDQVDIVKVSEEELEFLTGETDIEKGAEILEAEYDIPVLFITCGSKGSYYYLNDLGFVEAFKVDAVDTTGAGDAFMSGVLYNFNQADLKMTEIDNKFLEKTLKFANYSGSLAASASGAMAALPTLEEVRQLEL